MKYTYGQKIGDQGGFGSVHICTSELGDKYAIKFLENMDEISTERFKKEIRLTMRLSHPNIVEIIAYDAEASRKYYIMPLYASSLKAIIGSLHGAYDRQYKVITEILNGVVYLHSEGVLHRDLKPQNILYNSDSDIVINDLGLGRQIDIDSSRLTQMGAGFGTYRYTAPEQFMDASAVDGKADIFSLGKIIEDIVTYNLSYHIPTPELEYIINKCSQHIPDRRFSTVSELKTAVESVYQHLLGIADISSTDSLLAKLKLGNANAKETNELAVTLLNHENSDKLEEFFRYIQIDFFQNLEQSNSELAESLIIRLRRYYTGQGWGFGYTDTIGNQYSKNNSLQGRFFRHPEAVVFSSILITYSG